MFDNLLPATRSLLLATVGVFVLQLLLGERFFYPFMLWPLGQVTGIAADSSVHSVGFLPWQLLTYGFLHAGFGHLLFNMLALFFFGPPLEYAWGQRRFLIYYLTCIAGAGVIQLLVVSFAIGPGAFFPTVGASGGVYGLLLGYGLLFPNHRVMLHRARYRLRAAVEAHLGKAP